MVGQEGFLMSLRDAFTPGTVASLLLIGDEDGEDVTVVDVGDLGILFKGEKSVVFAPWDAVRFMARPIVKPSTE